MTARVEARPTAKTAPPTLARLIAAQSDVAEARETLAEAMKARQAAIVAALADERSNAQIGRALGTSRTTTQELINNARR